METERKKYARRTLLDVDALPLEAAAAVIGLAVSRELRDLAEAMRGGTRADFKVTVERSDHWMGMNPPLEVHVQGEAEYKVRGLDGK